MTDENTNQGTTSPYAKGEVMRLGDEDIAAEIEALPNEEARNDRALADEVIASAAALPELSLARLQNRLARAGVKVREWARIVKKIRAEHAKRGRKQSAADGFRADTRPIITVNLLEEHEINDRAVSALASTPNVYQRHGALVRVHEAKRRRPGEEPYTAIEIKSIPEALLRHTLSRAIAWREQYDSQPAGQPVLRTAHPPDYTVRAVHKMGDWPGVAPLYHVTEIPVLLPDGSIVSTPGYHTETGILYHPRVEVPDLSENPTREDAKMAAAALLDIVCDFPFETPERRAAWLAAFLTPIARWAFHGQAPFFVLDANQSGAGKGYLLKVIAWVALGREMDFTVQTDDEDEERKRITSKILKGEPMVLIDNIGKPFGSSAFEALLTTGVWSDRLMGTNEAPSLDAWVTWYGSGNNITFKRDDMRRRSCMIRLLSNELRPEERTAFKYPRLQAHVLDQRGPLLAAALTMLRAWLRSGLRPNELEGWGGAWGSFDDWDRVVRAAVVFAGLPDPIGAKATADAVATGTEGLRDLIEGLEEAVKQLGEGKGEVGTGPICDALKENDEFRRAPLRSGEAQIPLRLKKLRDAFAEQRPHHPRGHAPNAMQLGKVFGQFKEKVVQFPGGAMKRIGSRVLEGAIFWRVDLVPRSSSGTSSASNDEEVASVGP